MDIVHPDDRERVQETMAKLNALNKPMRFDCRIILRNGTERWIAHNSIPVRNDHDVFLGIRASVSNIDHRKLLEAKLRGSRARYRGLVENSRTMVLQLDRDGRVVFTNTYACERFAEVGKQVLNTPLVDIFQGECVNGAPNTRDDISSFLQTKGRLEIEVRIPRPDGVPFWSEWVGSFIPGGPETADSYICVGIDVSRRKALDKLKDDVARIVRHDLKSPLSGVIGLSRVIRRDDNLTERQKDLLRTIEDAGTIMLDLINQSLNLYKLETGTYEGDQTEFNLAGLIRDALKHVKHSVGRNVDIHFNLEGVPAKENTEIKCRTDRTLVFTMLCNLLKNALEASDGKPVIVNIATGPPCRIEIANSRPIPESIRETFFEKYVTAGKSGGTGLGTYSARLIARRLGGDVTMRSSENEGTVVSASIPLHQEGCWPKVVIHEPLG